MVRKPVLLTYLNGMPDFESMYPLLAVLAARGRIDVRTIIYAKLLRKEPRLKAAFEHYGHWPEVASKWRLKFFFQEPIRNADALLGISDPTWGLWSRRARGKYIVRVGKPSIFLQHGVYQVGVNARRAPEPMRYYSDLLLLWEPLGTNREFIAAETAEHVVPVGFTKQNVLPKQTASPALAEWMGRYSKRLLICQSFRWGGGRFHKDHIDQFYDMVETLLRRNPDLGIVIRSHRGKVRRNHRSHDRALRKQHDNLIFSHQYRGAMKGFTIHDALDIVDGMISPVSTTVLDCIYLGKPAAVFAEQTPLFSHLPQIAGIEDVENFIATLGDSAKMVDEPLLRQFGNLEANLVHAAEAVENFMLHELPRKS